MAEVRGPRLPEKNDRWRAPSGVVYRITSVRAGKVYGKQEHTDGRYGAVAVLNFDRRSWTFETGWRVQPATPTRKEQPMNQTEDVLEKMQAVIDRARIRDAGKIRAHKFALAVALIAPAVLADEGIDDAHKEQVKTILAECRALAVGARPGEQPETMLDGIPRDAVLDIVRAEVEAEIKEYEAPGVVL